MGGFGADSDGPDGGAEADFAPGEEDFGREEFQALQDSTDSTSFGAIGESTFKAAAAPDSYYVDDYDLYTAFSDTSIGWIEIEDGDEDAITDAGYTIPDSSITIIQEEFLDGFGNTTLLYYDVGVSDPSMSFEDTYEDLTFTYQDDEDVALKARLGTDISSTEGEYPSDDDLDAAVESYINTLTEDIINTTISPQFSFKKIEKEKLDYDNLSSFEETEAAQGTSTTLTTTTGYGGTTGIDY